MCRCRRDRGAEGCEARARSILGKGFGRLTRKFHTCSACFPDDAGTLFDRPLNERGRLMNPSVVTGLRSVAKAEGAQSELGVNAHASDRDRTSVAIIARMFDQLAVEREMDLLGQRQV